MSTFFGIPFSSLSSTAPPPSITETPSVATASDDHDDNDAYTNSNTSVETTDDSNRIIKSTLSESSCSSSSSDCLQSGDVDNAPSTLTLPSALSQNNLHEHTDYDEDNNEIYVNDGDDEEEKERKKIQECMDTFRQVLTTSTSEEFTQQQQQEDILSSITVSSSTSNQHEGEDGQSLSLEFSSLAPSSITNSYHEHDNNDNTQDVMHADSITTIETQHYQTHAAGTSQNSSFHDPSTLSSSSDSSQPFPFSLYDTATPIVTSQNDVGNLYNAPCFAESDDDDCGAENSSSQLSFRASMMDDSLDISPPSISSDCEEDEEKEECDPDSKTNVLHTSSSSITSPKLMLISSSSSLSSTSSKQLPTSNSSSPLAIQPLGSSSFSRKDPAAITTTASTDPMQNLLQSSVHDSTTFWNVGHSLLLQHGQGQSNLDQDNDTTSSTPRTLQQQQPPPWYSKFKTETEWNEMKQLMDAIWDTLSQEEKNDSIADIPSPPPPLPPSIPPSVYDGDQGMATTTEEEIFDTIPAELMNIIPHEFKCPLCNNLIIGAAVLDCGCSNSTCCTECIEKYEGRDTTTIHEIDEGRQKVDNDYVLVENILCQQQEEKGENRMVKREKKDKTDDCSCPSCQKPYTKYIYCPALDVATLNTVQNISLSSSSAPSSSQQPPDMDKNIISQFQVYHYKRLIRWRKEIHSRHEQYNNVTNQKKEQLMLLLLQKEEETFRTKNNGEGERVVGSRSTGGTATITQVAEEDRSRRARAVFLAAAAITAVFGLNFCQRR